MSNVVGLHAGQRRTKAAAALLGNAQVLAFDRFMIEEGLELLADFKAIENAEARRLIRQLVRDVARLQARVDELVAPRS